MAEDRVTLTERGFAAWNRHDAAALAALFADNGALRVLPSGEAATGPEQIRELAETRLRGFPDWHLDLETTYDCGASVCSEWRLTGTHEGEFMGIPPTHRRIGLTGASIFEFDVEGRVSEERVYFDAVTLLRQLAVLPE